MTTRSQQLRGSEAPSTPARSPHTQLIKSLTLAAVAIPGVGEGARALTIPSYGSPEAFCAGGESTQGNHPPKIASWK